MKKALVLALVLLLSLCISGMLFAEGAQEETETEGEYPPEMEEWLKEAKLGPHEESPQDWEEIERLAKEEGEVVVYSASSRVADYGAAFEKKYPEIEVTGYDLGSVKTVEKTIREQEAGLYNADIITTGGSGEVIYNLLKKNRIVNFVPDTVADEIPQELKDPLLVRIDEAIVFLYSTEAYGNSAPFENLWELTTDKWKGKVLVKNPQVSLSNLMGVSILVQHAEELAAAYEDFAGKEIELHEGVPDAGYEFLYRLIHNDLIITKSGSKVAEASGKTGQDNPPIGMTSYTYVRYNESKDFVNKPAQGINPVDKLVYPTYTGIARQAPNPNAAKLMTAFLLGDPAINEDTTLEKPYGEGRSLELLQGLAPYYEPGSKPPREDIPLPEGGEMWYDLTGWRVDPEFMWNEGPRVLDFWTRETSK